jgi:hypothetical protein
VPQYPSKKRLLTLLVVVILAGCAGGYLAADPDPLGDGQQPSEKPAGPPRLQREAGRD